jgi:hypothetical protein
MEETVEERRHLPPLRDEDVERIAEAVAEKAKASFHISEEKHYNDHKRLDKLLDVYDNATNIFIKTFIGFVIVGAILLAGIAMTKGAK